MLIQRTPIPKEETINNKLNTIKKNNPNQQRVFNKPYLFLTGTKSLIIYPSPSKQKLVLLASSHGNNTKSLTPIPPDLATKSQIAEANI